MEVELLAFDSMGARSMSTYVKTADLKLVIDPGVALGEIRYGLSPHRIEQERLEELSRSITDRATGAQVLIITHYHYDHYDPTERIPLSIYDGKRVLLKDPGKNINMSQGNLRAPLFMAMIKTRARSIEAADGKTYTFGGTKLSFSKAVTHGESNAMGYVIEVLIEEKKGATMDKVLHTSDIQGFLNEDQMELVLKSRPRLIIADGPVTYMLGNRFSLESLSASVSNIKRILSEGDEEAILVLDHHLLRDLDYRKYFEGLIGEFPGRIVTAAEFMGRKNDMLEARRKELYKEE